MFSLQGLGPIGLRVQGVGSSAYGLTFRAKVLAAWVFTDPAGSEHTYKYTVDCQC